MKYAVIAVFAWFIEALVIWLVMPLTGLPYNPTWWQSVALAFLVDEVFSLGFVVYYLRLKNGD